MNRWYFLLVITTASLYAASTSNAPVADPNRIRIFFLIDKATLCMRDNNYNAAINLLLDGKQILTNDPELADDKTAYLYKLLGRSYHKIKGFDAAVENFEWHRLSYSCVSRKWQGNIQLNMSSNAYAQRCSYTTSGQSRS